MKTVDPDAAVIFVINHRSNMDYVLVTYMASTLVGARAMRSASGRASGCCRTSSARWARYFVRRDSREPLYRKVLVALRPSRDRRRAHAGDVSGRRADARRQAAPAQARAAELHGVGFDPHGPRDAVFVPVGLNYDRVIEDRMQVAALMTPQGEKPRFEFSPAVLIAFLANNIELRLQGRLYRYGYACVSFGRPISLRQYVIERGIDFRMLDETSRFAEIERLGADADAQSRRGGAGVAGLAGRDRHSAAGKPLSALELKGEVEILIRRLTGERRAHPYSARRSGLCDRGRPAHAVAAPLRAGAGRPLSRQSGRRDHAALLCECDRASGARSCRPPRRSPPNRRNARTNALRSRPPESRRHPDGCRKDPKAGDAAFRHVPGHRLRGRLCDLDHLRQAPHGGRREADRPQGRPHLQGDAAILADRRAGLRLSVRQHDGRGRRQGAARELLRAARRGGACVRPGQGAARARASG